MKDNSTDRQNDANPDNNIHPAMNKKDGYADIISILQSLDGLVRLWMFGCSVIMLSALVAAIYNYTEDIIDGTISFEINFTLIFIQRGIELIAIVLLTQHFIVPFNDGPIGISFDMTNLGITRLPQSVVVGTLCFIASGISSKTVQLFLMDYYDTYLSDAVLDARIFLFIVGWACYVYAAFFHSTFHSEVDRSTDDPNLNVLSWRTPRYYEMTPIPRFLSILGYIYTGITILCICIPIYFQYVVFSFKWDTYLDGLETEFQDINEILIVYTSPFVIYFAFVGVYILRVWAGMNYVTHSAEIIVFATLTIRTMRDMVVVSELASPTPGVLAMDLGWDSILLMTTPWILPVVISSFEKEFSPLGSIRHNFVDFSSFVMFNVLDLDKWTRMLYPLAIVIGTLGFALSVSSISIDILDINAEAGVVVIRMNTLLQEVDLAYDAISTAVGDVSAAINPCLRAVQVNSVSSSNQASSNGNENNGGVIVNFIQVSTPSVPQILNYGDFINDYWSKTNNFECFSDSNSAGTFDRSLGSGRCEDIYIKATLSDENYFKQLSNNNEYNQFAVAVSDEPGYYDETCINVACVTAGVVITTLVVMTLIPFVGSFSVPARMAARAARFLFKMGTRMRQSFSSIKSKYKPVRRLIESVYKLATPGSGGVFFSESLYLGLFPLVILVILSLVVGFWRRRLERSLLIYIGLFIFFILLSITNIGFYLITTNIPILLQESLDSLDNGIIVLTVQKRDAWTMLEYSYLIGTISSGLWAIIILLKIIDILSDKVVDSNKYLNELRGDKPRLIGPIGNEIYDKERIPLIGAPTTIIKRPVQSGSDMGNWLPPLIISSCGLLFFISTITDSLPLFSYTAFAGDDASLIEKDLIGADVSSFSSELVSFHKTGESVCDMVEYLVKTVVNLALTEIEDKSSEFAASFKGIIASTDEFLTSIGSNIYDQFDGFIYLDLDISILYVVGIYLPNLMVTAMMLVGFSGTLLDGGDARRGFLSLLSSSMFPMLVISYVVYFSIIGLFDMFSIETTVFKTSISVAQGGRNALYYTIVNTMALFLLYANTLFKLDSRKVPEYLDFTHFNKDN